MSDQAATNPTGDDKGKGKAVEQPDVSMDEDDSSSDEEVQEHEEPEEEDDDNMEEISTENIIADGRRTRGKEIDYRKAAEEAGDDLDDDEDDDEDFEAKDDDDAMQG